MHIGYTFDEKYLRKISIKDWIEKTATLGVNSIELAVDTDILSIDTYIEIAKKSKYNNINLNYHIPYFSSKYYEISFSNDIKFLEKYNNFLKILEILEEFKLNKQSHIVVHCESFLNIENRNYNKTIDFITFLLEEIEKRNINSVISLETLDLDNNYKIGSYRYDLISILNTINSKKVGICYDVCHDAINFFPNNVPLDIEFFKHINYCHVHGYNIKSAKKHTSLKESSLNFFYILDFINLHLPNTTINLESLLDIEKNKYYENLIHDISTLNKLYK